MREGRRDGERGMSKQEKYFKKRRSKSCRKGCPATRLITPGIGLMLLPWQLGGMAL